jgi:hypothetical protein
MKPKMSFYESKMLQYLESPDVLIEENFKVMDLTKNGYTPFRLFSRQRDIIDALFTFRHNLITKPRQAGVSTTVAAFMATRIAFAP